MDKNHRDRVAFLRVSRPASFERGMKLRQVQNAKGRHGSQPDPVSRSRIGKSSRDARPGDVIGIPNHGTIRVGDTFSEGEPNYVSQGLPVFAPEILRRVRLGDTSRKIKQLRSRPGRSR